MCVSSKNCNICDKYNNCNCSVIEGRCMCSDKYFTDKKKTRPTKP